MARFAYRSACLGFWEEQALAVLKTLSVICVCLNHFVLL